IHRRHPERLRERGADGRNSRADHLAPYPTARPRHHRTLPPPDSGDEPERSASPHPTADGREYLTTVKVRRRRCVNLSLSFRDLFPESSAAPAKAIRLKRGPTGPLSFYSAGTG